MGRARGPGPPTRRASPHTGRTEYYNDPTAPEANTLIPASSLLVVDDDGAILLQRRRDTGQWALPGGAQDIGEPAAQRGVRVQPADLDQCDIHPSMRQQIGDYLAGTYPYLG
ncbi:NUDIX domain-containing protein [Streptomyces glebosus]|uniref:NUDIX domain-containing protein n=1 Tax=Streptomyces glebosus TaxID=249580 RepID=UPI00167D2BBA